MNIATAASAGYGVPVDYDPFAGGRLERVVPTTEPQRELWYAAQLGVDASLAYNESVSLRLRGTLDAARLRHALQAVVARHDALRGSFGPDGETFCVQEPALLDLPLSDLSALSQEAREAALAERRRLGVVTPFDLANGPLFRAELLRLDAADHLLLMHAHHIVCDGWSWWVIVRELAVAYAQEEDAASGLPPAGSYSDYALAEAVRAAGPEFQRDEQYWLSQLGGPLPVLELPTDHPRPAQRSFASRREDHELDAGLVSAVRGLGARRGISLFATLLGGFATLLSRIAGQQQVVVAIPAAGQASDGHDHLVGHCVNLLPLKFDLQEGSSFASVMEGAQTLLLDALDHQHYTFGTLLKKLRVPRDPERLPLTSVMFNIDQALDQEKAGFPGLAVEFTTNPRCHENFELSINAVQVEGRLRLETQYNADLFDAVTVRRWLVAFEVLLRAACEAPDADLAQLSLLSHEDRLRMAAWNSTTRPLPPYRNAFALLAAQAGRSPERVALCGDSGVLTYAQLQARTRRIADALVQRGVRPGDRVGVCLERGTDLVAAMLAAWRAGAAYVPLDPAYPADRLRYMADDAGLPVVISEGRLADSMGLARERLLLLDADAAQIEAAPEATAQDGVVDRAAAAYVIYTSGSTGKPKGVAVPHGATLNFLESMRRAPGLSADDVLLAVTTTSFDISVLELFLPLATGARIVLASREQAMDGAALAALIERESVTVLQATPATWHLLLDAGWRASGRFKALCGGEPLPVELATRLLQRGVELWNMYGPTETTVWSTCARITPGDSGVPDIHIGPPIANTTVWVLDGRGQVCLPGVSGELCIGGAGVSLGYLGREALTAEMFIPDHIAPFDHDTGLPARLYRTGDRARWRHDGVLEHQGRMDFQVKIRGYRIELGEIEAVLEAVPGVVRAVVVVREDQPGDQRLVAYVAAAGGVDEDMAYVRLRETLPRYMVPQHLLVLESLPLLPNGKVNRKALPAPLPPQAPQAAASSMQAPARQDVDPRVAYLITTWSEILGTSVAPQDNFFDLGGHSMLAAKMANRISRETGYRVKLMPLATQTLAHLAAEIPLSAIPAAVGGTEATDRKGDAPAPALDDEQRAFFFGNGARRLFGMLHRQQPRHDSGSDVPLLVASPLLQEGVSCQRALWTLCETLAGLGGTAMRFDWHGSGESGGDGIDARLEGMLEDLGLARERLRSDVGCEPRTLALYSACLPVLEAAMAQARPVDLVLWDPVLRGDALIEGWRRLHRLQFDGTGRFRHPRRVACAADELLGFDVAEEFLDALVQLDFRHRSLPPGSRLQVVSWQGGAMEDVTAFLGTQREAGVQVDHVVLSADDRPVWDDPLQFEAQVFPRRSVGEVARLLAGAPA